MATQIIKSSETSHHHGHTHITTEAMTTAHLATLSCVSNTLLCAMYNVVNFTRLKHTINGTTEQVRKRVGSNQEFCSHIFTVNCSCIINLMYEIIKLATCSSHGLSSLRNFVHDGELLLLLMIEVAIPIPIHF